MWFLELQRVIGLTGLHDAEIIGVDVDGRWVTCTIVASPRPTCGKICSPTLKNKVSLLLTCPQAYSDNLPKRGEN